MNAAFSLHRFEQLWAFYHPRMMIHLIAAIFTLLASYLLMLYSFYTYSIGTWVIAGNALMLPFYLSPLVFASYRDRSMLLQIPASQAEKGLLPILYCFIAIPVALLALWFAIEGIGASLGAPKDLITTCLYRMYTNKQMPTEFLEMGWGWRRWITEFFPLVISCYVVYSVRSHRILKVIGAWLISLLVVSLFSGSISFARGFVDGVFNNYSQPDSPEFYAALARTVRFSINMTCAMSIIILLVGLPMLWRKAGRSQI